MNKKSIRIIAVSLCVSLLIGTAGAVYALSSKTQTKETKITTSEKEQTEVGEITKDETVYVLAGNDGSVKKIIVSDWIKNALSKNSISDKSNLKNIENVKGDEKYTLDNDNMTVWDAEGNDIYYKGDIEKELPVGLSVSYKLDGKTVSADKIKGKSGKVTIRFDYDNRQFETVTIDGKSEKIYVPFAMLTGMLLDSDTFRNVEVSNGKIINDGNRTAVIGLALPGLQNNLGIDKEKLDIPDYVEIIADVKKFKLGTTVTIATNELFNELDTSKLNKIDEIINNVSELSSGMNQLIDGSSALYGGLDTLLSKSSELISGINQMADGTKALKEASTQIDGGVGDLKDGISSLSMGLSKLSENNETLNGGAKQVFETLLSTANTQLSANGISACELTIDNYSEVLDGVIASLDKTAVYNKALAQVTSAVEANRTVIEQKVTAAVRETVEAQIIPVATGGQMTKETYDSAVKAGQISDVTKSNIDGAVNTQMNSADVKATIESQTKIEINKAISENMASPEVQEKLSAASQGAKAVISLKSSLDSYNAFYLGLLTYTSGVSSAKSGAETLFGGATKLKDGTTQLKDGTASLYDGILLMQNKVPALTDGVSRLKDGAMQLSGGLKKLNDEGINKIINLVNGDIKGLATRLKATVDVSKNYRNFSGKTDETDGQVKFIYRTDEIK